MSKRLRNCLTVYTLLATVTIAPVWAGPFNELIIFGDSLSDIGNVQRRSFSLQPGSHYFAGRFSNGPAWSELFANELGLAPLIPSEEGGGNFAFGGAQSSGTGLFAGIVIDDVDDQVDDFLARGPVDPDALVVVFAGANDLFFGQTNPTVPVSNLVNDIERLIAAQTRNLLVMNIPLLGLTPRFNQNPTEAATMNALSVDFNTQLAAELDGLEASHTDVNFYRLDIAALISDGVANPASYGLSNVTDPAAPGLESGQVFYNSNNIVSNPHEYLFWDDIHPTAAAHAVLAQQALAAVRRPGDFQFDGEVTGEDFLFWQTDPSVGSLTAWGANYAPLAAVATGAIVPEPRSLVLAFLLMGLVFVSGAPRDRTAAA
ncbi:MAG: SGNH/GDSL hydrolase family protein [Planctomycetota bacterium]